MSTSSPIPVSPQDAYVLADKASKRLAGGAGGYITKPFQVDVLMTAVRAVPRLA